MSEPKRQFRARARQRLASLVVGDAEQAARSAAEHFMSLRPSLGLRVQQVALYSALPHELGTVALDTQLRAAGLVVAYPRVNSARDGLSFHQVDDLAELSAGVFGILEPAESAAGIGLDAIDLFIVPGVAFDESGRRMGYGRGYYDRVLAATPRSLRVGYCYRAQITDRVPIENHDQCMDWVVTEEGTVRSGRSGAGH